MIRPFPRLFTLLIVALSLGACGAAATLPPQDEDGNLVNRSSEAVWYAENGDHLGLAQATENSILILPPGDDSTYINGAFSINIPDQEPVAFSAKVALPRGSVGNVLFRAYVQDGASFPMLAEVSVQPETASEDFFVDLSPYRGHSLLLILAVSSPDGSPLRASALWIDPKVLTP
jgi:hypothetical protein